MTGRHMLDLGEIRKALPFYINTPDKPMGEYI